jgi:predicted Zn-dependent protease with MMP-like domain
VPQTHAAAVAAAVRLSRRAFERLVDRAVAGLPRRFREKLANIAVVVEDWADDETLAEMGIDPPDTLYGLYRGTDLTRRDSTSGGVLPDVITIYQGPIEEDCERPEDMEGLVQDTVIHEIGHYFGLDDDRLEELEQGDD